MNILRFNNFFKDNSYYLKEHNRLIQKYKIDLLSFKGINLSFIYLYKIVTILFENDNIFLKKTDVILLTLTAIVFMSKQDKEIYKELLSICQNRNILYYLKTTMTIVRKLRILSNIVLKDFVVIQNVEQLLKSEYSIKLFYDIFIHVLENKININDFIELFDNTNKIKDLRIFLNKIKMK